MSTIKAAYLPIDIHGKDAPMWPATVPPMTEAAAANAVRRLYRWAIGTRLLGKVHITTGNRSAARFDWEGNFRSAWINPGKGWKEFAHDLSHWLDFICNGETKHGKHHASFERRLVKQIIARGWLEPEAPKPVVVVAINNTEAKRRLALERIMARIENWERKQRRAENALVKLHKQRRYYTKALTS